MPEQHDLSRFLTAQAGTFEQAFAEIRSGRKRSHWMWFIFPQFRGLGYSEMSRRFAINSIDEARSYLEHPILGVRLRSICSELLKSDNSDPNAIFGSPDDLKLRSSMTLFDHVDEADERIFRKVLKKFFAGREDERTVELLEQQHTDSA
ncbi:MAG: DUF1810 domain-containing protein [Chloracidobacterium sp.]|nr:DUF1810 domain-containing protein [Chloracidobacterium sp.]MCO5332790.1 DUF1810 domain-containing protein [Pyrinomonadaceae bacterium]